MKFVGAYLIEFEDEEPIAFRSLGDAVVYAIKFLMEELPMQEAYDAIRQLTTSYEEHWGVISIDGILTISSCSIYE